MTKQTEKQTNKQTNTKCHSFRSDGGTRPPFCIKLTNIAGLVLLHNGISKLLVHKDIVIPVLLFDTSVRGLIPEDIVEQGPQH